ncbi:MAG TPA: ATP-binding protein [Candidatus Kapabacteria bacterium]|nr:ATP-binding protein [Candidatus Kapabacteria bacterium]
MDHLLIPGSLDELEHVHEWTRRLLDRAHVPDNLQHNVLLALSECVTNAIRHGCREARGNKVKLECRVGDGEIMFRIRDKGAGFSPDCVPDPTKGASLHRPGGRGVFLLKALSNESSIESSHDGTTVTFRFRWK